MKLAFFTLCLFVSMGLFLSAQVALSDEWYVHFQFGPYCG
jgi:hypothetical protein